MNAFGWPVFMLLGDFVSMLYMFWTCMCGLYLGLVECLYDGLIGFCSCYSICHDVNFSFVFLVLPILMFQEYSRVVY